MRMNIALLLSGFLIGLIGVLFIPSPFKFFIFIIPLICICIVLSPEDDYFNINLFFVFLFIFFLIPSSMITFDTSSNYSPIMVVSIGTIVIDILVIVFFVIVPIIMIIAIVYAFVVGNVSNAVQAIVRLLLVMFSVILGAMIFEIFDLPSFGISGFVLDLYAQIFTFILTLPQNIYGLVESTIETLSLGQVDMPDLPGVSLEGEDITNINFNTLWTRFNSMDYQTAIYAVHDSLPIMVTMLCGVFLLLFARKEWEDQILESIGRMGTDREAPERQYFPNLNYKMIVYMTILIISAFGIFLTYANIYQNEESTLYQTFATGGYFSIYLFMSIIPLIMMNFTGLTYYKDSNLVNTVKGVVFGLFGLFLIVQLMNSGRTMSAMSMENHRDDFLYILNTFIFVAPSESIMFHIFIPALVMGIIVSYSRARVKEIYELTTRERLIMIEGEIKMKKEIIEIYESLKQKKYIAEERKELNSLLQEKNRLEGEIIERVRITEDSIFGRPASVAILIIFGIIIPNFVFASFHWFLSGIDDYVLFWTSGLGIIYFVGGCWFTFIGLRYGWLACILTHAFHNTMTILLVLAFTGGI